MHPNSTDYEVLSNDWDANLGNDEEFEALLIYLLKNRNDCINGNKQKCKTVKVNQHHKQHHYNVESINPFPSSVNRNEDFTKKVSTRSLDSINGGYFVKRFVL